MGKSEGDEVVMNLPSGTQTYEILEIAYHEIDFEG
jgi:transcription elongation factor GreA